MKQLQIDAATRPPGITPPALRRRGFAPAVIYGKGMDPVLLQVEVRSFEKLLQQGARNHLVNLNIQGMGTYPVMVK